MTRWLPVLLAACTGTDPEPADPAADGPLTWALDAPGPYRVGFRDLDLTYDTLGVSRTIRVSVWYPTEAEMGRTVRYSGEVPGAGELGDAPPAPSPYPDGWPVLAYSHGDQGFGATSADLMRFLASHGWVALAPDHTDNLLWADVEPDPQSQWYDRPRDVSAALDWLGGLPSDDPLHGADTRRVLMSGHSRGASTVLSLLGTATTSDRTGICPGCTDDQVALFDDLADPRLAGGLLLDGAGRGELQAPGPWGTGAPLMLQSAFDATPTFEEQSAADLVWVWVAGACHQTFALGLCLTLDPEEGFAIVDTYALAFARHVILGDDAPGTLGVLSGEVVVDARATVRATR